MKNFSLNQLRKLPVLRNWCYLKRAWVQKKFVGGLFGQIQPIVPKLLPIVCEPFKLPIAIARYEK